MAADAELDMDLERQATSSSLASSCDPPISEHKTLRSALADVAECRAKLKTLGEPPEHEAVEEARSAIASIESALAVELENLHLTPIPPGTDAREWAAQLAQKESELHAIAQNSQMPYQALIQTDELHRCYELLLRDAEMDLIELSCPSEFSPRGTHVSPEGEDDNNQNEDLQRILAMAKEGPVLDVELKGRDLTCIPDAFGRISTMVSLDLSKNRLKVLSDSIGGLLNLETLNLEHNNLEFLPDAIGLLKNLKVLNVSSNKLAALPESILHCSSLVSLTANLNQISYLPSRIGFSLVNLEELSLQWNKIRTLPSSLCNLRSLKRLEVKFNHLKALPSAIGNLTNLEILDVSCNFMDLQMIPDSIGDLISLVEIDLSYNQIKSLPDSFGRLQNLRKINLYDNPLVVPPPHVAAAGTEAIMSFMKERWQRFLEEEEKKLVEQSEERSNWFTQRLGGSWLSRVLSAISYRPSQTSGSDELLNQQL